MSGMKPVNVLRSVRVADSGNHHGREIVKGTEDEVPEGLFDALKNEGYVAELDSEHTLRDDGPTIAEFLTAGYLASNYPPQGYAPRSTPEEIAAAVADFEAAKKKADDKAAKAAAKMRDAILAELAKLSEDDVAKAAETEKVAIAEGDSKDIVLGKIADARIAAQG